MSGSAALSAARKRRASTTPPVTSNGAPMSYYSRGQPSVTAQVPVSIPHIGSGPGVSGSSYGNEQARFAPQIMPNGFPPQPMNIYQNIELIKQQLAERTKLIQMQGSSMSPENLKILHRQNEIQTQILKQKIASLKQIEAMNQGQGTGSYGNSVNVMIPTISEPEFIYEKGIPQKNPKYVSVGNANQPQRMQIIQNPNTIDELNITPYVTMISDTGVIPPPIVIIKSHDVKLQEHNHVLHELIRKFRELQSTVSNQTQETTSNRNHVTFSDNVDITKDNVEGDAQSDEGDEEEELLMDVVMNDLTNSREFVEGIVNKIVTETNLSEVIMKIEPLVKENQELRSLIHSQQQMMNEMNTMLLRLLNQNTASSPKQETFQDTGLDGDGLYQSEMTEIILTHAANIVSGATTEESISSKEPEPEPEPEPSTLQTLKDEPNDADKNNNDNNEDYTPIPPDDEYLLDGIHEPVSLIVNDIQ